jgi:hypothetical protein
MVSYRKRRKDFAVNPDELSVNLHERADKALRVVGIDAKAGRKTGQKHKRASKPRAGHGFAREWTETIHRGGLIKI